jgi:cytochrome c553
MKKVIQFLLICVVGFSIKSCYYDEALPAQEIPDGTVVTYKADIAPILTGCTTCHGGGVNPDLRNTQQAYNSLFPNYVTVGNPTNSKLYYNAPGNSSSVHANVGFSLDDTQLAYIKYWINHDAEYE